MEFALQRPEPGKWASAVFSLLMHAGLVLVLYFGVQWQRREPEPISVELVASLPPMTAPPPVEDRPAPPPPKPAEVKPVEVKPAPLAKPDIALKEPEKKKPVKKEEPKPLPPPPKPEVKPEKKPEAKPADKKIESPKLSRQDELMNQALKQTDQAKRDAKMVQSAEEARATGNAAAANAQRAGVIAEWKDKVSAKVRGKMILPLGLTGRPTADFEVELLVTGEFKNEPKLVKSSGNAALDEAIRRAILAAEPFPKPPEEALRKPNPFKFDPLDPRFSN